MSKKGTSVRTLMTVGLAATMVLVAVPVPTPATHTDPCETKTGAKYDPPGFSGWAEAKITGSWAVPTGESCDFSNSVTGCSVAWRGTVSGELTGVAYDYTFVSVVSPGTNGQDSGIITGLDTEHYTRDDPVDGDEELKMRSDLWSLANVEDRVWVDISGFFCDVNGGENADVSWGGSGVSADSDDTGLTVTRS